MSGVCYDCGHDLSYCGEMTLDGPSLDCLVCRLRDKINTLLQKLENTQAIVEMLIEENRELLIYESIDLGNDKYKTLELPDYSQSRLDELQSIINRIKNKPLLNWK